VQPTIFKTISAETLLVGIKDLSKTAATAFLLNYKYPRTKNRSMQKFHDISYLKYVASLSLSLKKISLINSVAASS